MRKRVLCTTVALMYIIYLLFCVGCSEEKENSVSSPPPYPPYAEEVCGVLGQDMESVLTKIGLSADDFVYESGSYYLKETVEFCDYAFRMRITTYRDFSDNLVQGIGYVLEYKGEPENAAKAVITIREKLLTGDGLVRPNPAAKDQKLELEEITYEDLVKIFNDREWSAGLGWVLSTDLSAVPTEVLESTYSPTCISLRYQVGYPNAGEEAKGGNGTVYITLDYGLTVDSKR